MRIIVGAGVLLLTLATLFVGMILPDTFESWAFSRVATKAEELKRARIVESPEYGELDAENQRLHEQIRACQAETGWNQPEEDRGMIQAIIGKLW